MITLKVIKINSLWSLKRVNVADDGLDLFTKMVNENEDIVRVPSLLIGFTKALLGYGSNQSQAICSVLFSHQISELI